MDDERTTQTDPKSTDKKLQHKQHSSACIDKILSK